MVSAQVKAIVRQRANYCCAYCGVSEMEVGSELEVDHFHPLSAGGTDDLDNLVCCCSACNRFKGAFWAAFDAPRRLLHPHRDDLSQHLRTEPDGSLTALTETGRFHIQHLHLDRPQLRALRRQRLAAERLRQKLPGILAEVERREGLTTHQYEELIALLRQVQHLLNQQTDRSE